MRYFPHLLVILGLTALPLIAHSDELDDEHSLSMAFETPHTDWAQPYALGNVRVLFFGDGMGTQGREIIESMQRFSIEADAVFHHQIIDSPDFEWCGAEAGHQRMLRLLEKPYDVYVFNGVAPALLTAEEQVKVFDPVTKGAGIVFIGCDDARVLKPERRLAALPAFLAQQETDAAFQVGEGRGVRLPARPDIPYRVGWESEYDYWQERLGSAVLWAAGRVPEMVLDATVQTPSIARPELPAWAAKVSWSNARAGKTNVEIALRRWDGLKLPLGDLQCQYPQGDQALRLPVLTAGGYHLDVRAISDRGVEAWRTVPFAVTSPHAVESVTLDRDWGEIGDSLSGRVALSGTPLAGEALQVRLMDRRGRILTREALTVAGNTATFAFPVEPWMPMLLRVEASLAAGNDEIASAYEFFQVTKRHQGQFNFLMWDSPVGTLAAYAEQSLTALGVTLQLSRANPEPLHSAYEAAWVPYTTRVGYLEPTFWNDEPASQEYIDRAVQEYQGSREHGVFAYSLGDETVTRGASTDPRDLPVYRRYLAQEYGGIAALNASWGTQFAGFDEVGLSDAADNDEAASLRAKNYPRWYDRQAYQCWNFVQYCKRFGDAFKRNDPQAKTGFEGAGTFEAGDDLTLIIRTNGFWSPYPGVADEVVRSLAPKGFPHSNWMGYTKDPDSLLSRYWRMITRGCDSVWWWRWENLGRFHGLIAPHLGPYPECAEMVEDTEVVRNGLGSLLNASKMLDDGIAILYSMPSAYTCRVEHGPSYGDYTASHTAWFTAIRGLGLQFRYVTDRMLRLGEFRARDVEVLILPRAEAIGPKEAEVIRAFAEGGGTVIADLRPGIYDGHCKPLERGALDDLFGVQRGPQAAAATAAARIEGDGEPGFTVAWEGAHVDPSVRSVVGKAVGSAGDMPLCVVNAVGKGRAILLNFGMADLPGLDAPETPDDVAAFIRSLLEPAGVAPKVRLADREGKRVRETEVVRWRNGRMEFLALFNEGMGMGWLDEARGRQPIPTRVTLPAPAYVYDLRAHKPLGLVQTFETEIIPCRATFFAVMPGEAPTVRIALSAPEASPGEQVMAHLTVPRASGLHALRIRATAPDGSPADWLDQVVVVGREGADVTVPIAFNDPAGQWRITATDLYTEKPVTAVLDVKGE